MTENNIKKGSREVYNEIREKLKAKKIFKVNSLRSLTNQSVRTVSQDSILNPSPGFEEQSFKKNILAFDQKYEIIEKIGQGGNAVIKKCLEKSTKNVFAVKISQMDRERMLQIKRIFKTIKALSNPHILKYKELYLNVKQRSYYLVTEYLPFQTLRKFSHLPQTELRYIIKQLLEVLVYLHSQKVCHRDVKPDNILYDQTRQFIHLIDFGICKRFFLRGNPIDMWTPTGTLNYKAPEMFEGGGYSESVDMWAVGVTIYKLVTGQEPFINEYLIDTIEKIQAIDYNFGQEWANYSKFLKDLVSRLLKEKSLRLTAKEALKHPWFLQEKSQSPGKSSTKQQVMSRLSVTNPSQKDFVYNRLLSVRKAVQSIDQLKTSVHDKDIFTS